MFEMYATIAVFILLCNYNCGCVQNPEELLSVVAIYRHGDRNPMQMYANDPYKNDSYWPEGLGQLTNLGKEHQYELGKWFRQRYSAFLPTQYSKNDIYVRSTDVDRTLMSALANTAGLYPPEGSQIWHPDLNWQPIPVHTVPQTDDYILMQKSCAKFDDLYEQAMNSEGMRKLNQEIEWVYDYVSLNTGENVSSINDVYYVWNALAIESERNLTLPDWTRRVYPDQLEPYACLTFAMDCNTTEMARLMAGPFFGYVLDHFKNFNATRPKFLSLSVHETTIGNILNAMGAFEIHCPPYSSAIILEFRKYAVNDTKYVNVLYKKFEEPEEIVLGGCKQFNCHLDDLIAFLEPITVSYNDWIEECNCVKYSLLDESQSVVVFGICVVFFSIFCGVGVGMFICKRRRPGPLANSY